MTNIAPSWLAKRRTMGGPPGIEVGHLSEISQSFQYGYFVLALPREAPELPNVNSLAEGLGKTVRIDCQCVSAPLPKPISTPPAWSTRPQRGGR
jgi:hypothetical protein